MAPSDTPPPDTPPPDTGSGIAPRTRTGWLSPTPTRSRACSRGSGSSRTCSTPHVVTTPDADEYVETRDVFGNRIVQLGVHHRHDAFEITAESIVDTRVPAVPSTGRSWEEVAEIARNTARGRSDQDRAVSRGHRRTRHRSTEPTCSRHSPTASSRPAAPWSKPSPTSRERSSRCTGSTRRPPTGRPRSTRVLENQRGVCQDFAHLATAVLRWVGLPASYVSGYIETEPPPGEVKSIGADASHAWCSVWTGPSEDDGPAGSRLSAWLDVDPTNHQVPPTRHVTVGWGRDYADVAPVRGVVLGPGSNQLLDVAVDVDSSRHPDLTVRTPGPLPSPAKSCARKEPRWAFTSPSNTAPATRSIERRRSTRTCCGCGRLHTRARRSWRTAWTSSPKDHFLNWQQDPFGNHLARLVFNEPAERLDITVDLVADMTVINPFDFFVEESAEKYPFFYEPQTARDLDPYLRPTTRPGEQLKRWLDGIDRSSRVRIEDFLVAVNQRLSEDIAYSVRMEPGVQTPEQTFERGVGSCRDTGWLLVEALRHLGLAARFVSGYLVQLTDRPAGPRRSRRTGRPTSPICTHGRRSTSPVPAGSAWTRRRGCSPARVTSRSPAPHTRCRRRRSPVPPVRPRSSSSSSMSCGEYARTRASRCRTPPSSGRPSTRWGTPSTNVSMQATCA